MDIDLRSFKSPKDALKALKKRKQELEKEFEEIRKKVEKGALTKEEYEERRKKLEREYVEVMDRIVQMSYISSQM
ncbi:MAG TPA: hypothetical protein ENG54_02595 [Thermofilum sp.]|nr:hypothetical protein [Thermofilum sp.]